MPVAKGKRIKEQRPDRVMDLMIVSLFATYASKRPSMPVEGQECRLDEYLDIDRVPDPKNKVRALLTADDCVRLLEAGVRNYASITHILSVR